MFKQFVIDMFTNFPEKIAKNMVNLFTGLLGKKMSKKVYGCIVEDCDTACSLYNEEFQKSCLNNIERQADFMTSEKGIIDLTQKPVV